MRRMETNTQNFWRRVRGSINVKSSGFDRLGHDLSDGMFNDLIGGSETGQLRLGGTKRVRCGFYLQKIGQRVEARGSFDDDAFWWV
jgi:hypothetical protein